MKAVIEQMAWSVESRSRQLWVLACNALIFEEAPRERLRTAVVARGRTIYPAIEWAVFNVHL